RALGVTMQLPIDDRHTYSKTYLESTLAVLLGGRVAEEIVFGELTTGAGNDIERASKMARRMVCEWGMSETLGPLAWGDNSQEVFLGRDLVHHKDYSEETAKLIDAEVKAIVQKAYQRARTILEENLDTLHALAKALLERETLSGEEVDKILKGESLDKVSLEDDPSEENKQEEDSSGKEDFEIS
ncbi:MAG TPA: cell division protein FtsH, partial [Desulfonauticus sp.]|nr:cell division protein FtsH [Desulfonauticus sp.]